jgi:adenosylhomocysteine nucleosidase
MIPFAPRGVAVCHPRLLLNPPLKHLLFGLLTGIVGLFFALVPATASEPHRIAVFSAFQPELKAIETQMIPEEAAVKASTINGTRFDEIDLHGRHFVFGLSGQSMVNAAMNTQLVIDRFHVDAVVFCGIAGGINPHLHPGDVIIPAEWIHQMESIWANPDPERPGQHILPTWWTPKYGNYHDIYPNDVTVVREGITEPRDMHAFPADPDLLDMAAQATSNLKLQGSDGGTAQIIIGGGGMSGPVFLDNAKFRHFAYETWHVDGHDMESTAVAQVGWVNHVPVLIIRGLCDLAGGQAGTIETGKYLQLAAKNAAIVTARTLLGFSQPAGSSVR